MLPSLGNSPHSLLPVFRAPRRQLFTKVLEHAKTVERIRTQVAHSLMEDTTQPIEPIAESIGFRNPPDGADFPRLFVAHRSKTPGIRRNSLLDTK